MKAVINWHGDRGTGRAPHVSKSIINGVSSLAALQALVTDLVGYTTCNRGRASVVDVDGGTPTPPGVDANVDERAVIYLKDNTADSIIQLTIPAWDTTGHPLDSGSEGDRIATADVVAIAASVATATGKSLVGMWGKHIKVT